MHSWLSLLLLPFLAGAPFLLSLLLLCTCIALQCG
jgi:hypothetical protein